MATSRFRHRHALRHIAFSALAAGLVLSAGCSEPDAERPEPASDEASGPDDVAMPGGAPEEDPSGEAPNNPGAEEMPPTGMGDTQEPEQPEEPEPPGGDEETPGEADGNGEGGSGNAGGAGPSSGGAPDDPDPMDPQVDPPADYPAGPYGEGTPKVGDVLENLAVRGLVNFEAKASTDFEVEESSFEALRDSGKRFALLITARGWCGSCKIAAKELGVDREAEVKEVTANGGVVAHVLLEGVSGGPSDQDLESWAAAAELDVAVFGPGNDRLLKVFPEREWMFIVELATMKVVHREQVELYVTPTVTEKGLNKLKEMLAN